METAYALGFPITILIAYLVTRPASAPRVAARRARRVARHPELVNLGDVHARLFAALPRAHASFARERISILRVDARTAWTWLDRFGVESFVLSLAAGNGHADMTSVLRGERAYDEAGLRAVAWCREPELFELAA